ncbi:alanine/glycine:cation symporter family protein [Mucispirillum schaedleri]|uniref:Amino-acid carrier protein AlsT n=1 Tax=Mucispirillum schaedleri ASF457 TaxID=1379858 RepID=V2RJH4_9BACT|nr:sodium:alanine symporter family protein [Mucispirillum schaedleri]MCX4360758.1 sodium:alanine symporter family protein [Mucispirillum schaedleri]USF24751.1 Amino-acid carrier protein AlsT [Mucispirillum schaedleri ASF457]SIW05756.1 Sodium/alanine symporter AgcS [Mucispirillum schaedleri ASF457]
MDSFVSYLNSFRDIVWGVPMILLLLGTHIYLTYKTGFIQRKVPLGIKLSITKDDSSAGDVSQFQALTTALASTIGTGNIIGVGTAVYLGGPGAVFWCWITGVFGIATKYAESLISVKYRVQSKDGRMLGGAMYALERGLNMKKMAVAFALFAMIASFGIGCATQINAIAEVFDSNFAFAGVPRIYIGIIFGILTAFIIIGGIKSIARVCANLVPFMAVFYILASIYILFLNYDYLFPALKSIITLAFAPGSVEGGLIGQGIIIAARFGIARGLFSNESGLGSAPLVASAAQTKNPVRQALVSATGTFWDTVVFCLITGIIIVSTVMKYPEVNMINFQNGGQMTTAAFNQIPYFGSFILIIALTTFAYSTILGWSYYGERCAEYLFGRKAILPYKLLYIAVLIFAPVLALDMVWTIADILNAFMAVPNLIAVLLLSSQISNDTKFYIDNIDHTHKEEIPVVDK